jgi:hypothetical protein
MIHLGMLAGGSHGEAVAINNQGNVIGDSTTGKGRAVLWTLKRGT